MIVLEKPPKDPRAAAHQKVLLALTAYSPLHKFKACTLLEVTIFTGVMHQIRCQLAHIAHPVVGDKIYGRPDESPANMGLREPLGPVRAPSGVEGPQAARPDLLDHRLGRHFLHAAAIAFTHPRTSAPLRFESPLPPELKVFLDQLPR